MTGTIRNSSGHKKREREASIWNQEERRGIVEVRKKTLSQKKEHQKKQKNRTRQNEAPKDEATFGAVFHA